MSLFDAARALLPGTDAGADADADALHARILRCHAALAEQPPDIADRSAPALRRVAARCALDLVARLQRALDGPHPPAIGARDLAVLRALLSLVFQPLAPALVPPLFDVLFPRGASSQPPQTLVTTAILNRHAPDLLRASVALAWSSSRALRPFVLRLLESLPLSQVMTDLGAVLSSSPPPPTHVRKLCSSLLTQSLLRPGGVRALFAAVFGEQESSDDPQLEKYERIADILMTIPANLGAKEYFAITIPRLTELLSNDVPAAYRRATSFSLSRMLSPGFVHHQLVSSLFLPLVHHPFARAPSPMTSSSSPTTALSMLTILLLNTDPSPIFITLVLSPIIPALYTLMFHLDAAKASDPVLKESVRGLLATWGRVVEIQDCINTLWSVIHAERIYWQVDVSGNISSGPPTTTPVLLTPDDMDMTSNPFDLYPDPAHLVQYIKSLDRIDVASGLFARSLEVYHLVDADQAADPSRALLYLQLIIQMQTQLSDESSRTNILRKPEHILSFVKHALESQEKDGTSKSPARRSQGLGLEDLKIVDEADGDSDSDDEPEELNGDGTESNMTGTAINLLLAILEANPELSAINTPILADIFSLLEPISNDTSESIRALVREARMVMTARLASSSTSWPAPQRREDDAQQVYQKALKLLQDPILPVRAHGLLLLRQLVSSHPHASAPPADSALIPAIMSIFMQSIQEDDSYIFLNAVQGLSAMVDGFGKEVLGSLLETYTHKLSASSMGTLSKQEVDTKVRVGEALGQVIRRCGDALAIYTDIIVPRLIFVFRSRYAPTVLRTSSISLLTQCIKTSAIALLRYIDELAMGMIDVLQVEMVSTRPSPPKDGDEKTPEIEQREEKEVLDSKPTTVDSKLPPLRRAALHFWTTLLQQLTRAIYDGTMVERLPNALLKRAKVTLRYIASTDEDGIVRAMAREANEAIDQLNRATLGI